MLLQFEEIQNELDNFFLPLEPMVHGCRLLDSRLESDEVRRCERDLNVSFPKPFRSLLLSYCIDNLAIGQIAFLTSGDYLSGLTRFNVPGNILWGNFWWVDGDRPQDIILIALSDPYSILLNCATGAVSAFVSDDGWEERYVVAMDLECFFRGLGTLELKRLGKDVSEEMALDVAVEVGSCKAGEEFWRWIAM